MNVPNITNATKEFKDLLGWDKQTNIITREFKDLAGWKKQTNKITKDLLGWDKKQR